jgi:chemotaxis-related protein WspB
MLFLLFYLGDDRYLLETQRVVQVLPLVQWKAVPQAPAGVAGLFNYRGSPVPLIDLGQLALGRPSRRHMSTRIILVEYCATVSKDPDNTRLLALLAEKITTTLQRSHTEFTVTGVDGAPYLGPVTTDAVGIMQRVEVEHLLPTDLRDLLFRQMAET